MSAWKQFERRVAAFFDGVRCAFSGAQPNLTGTRADVVHSRLYIECKQRKRHSVCRVWDDAATKAKAEGRIPVVALSEKNRKGFWILLHSSDAERIGNAGNVDGLPLWGAGSSQECGKGA